MNEHGPQDDPWLTRQTNRGSNFLDAYKAFVVKLILAISTTVSGVGYICYELHIPSPFASIFGSSHTDEGTTPSPSPSPTPTPKPRQRNQRGPSQNPQPKPSPVPKGEKATTKSVTVITISADGKAHVRFIPDKP